MRGLLLSLFLLYFSVLHAQDFSGEIVYKISIIKTNDSLDLEKLLKEKKGTTASYIITKGYYKSTYFKNNAPTYSYTYHTDSKKMFDNDAESDYITYRDSRKNDIKYGESKIYKDSTTTILGYPCYLVTSTASYGTTKTYYSDKVRVPFESFQGHEVGNWYNELKALNGAITIKSITTYKDYIEIQEAVKITKRKVDKKEFDLPNKPIAASFSALDQPVKMQQPTQKVIDCYRNNLLKAPSPHGRTKKVSSYIIFVLTKEGNIKYAKPYEKDEHGLHKIAIDILTNCGIKFNPGTIGGAPVDSQVIFPVEFTL